MRPLVRAGATAANAQASTRNTTARVPPTSTECPCLKPTLFAAGP